MDRAKQELLEVEESRSEFSAQCLQLGMQPGGPSGKNHYTTPSISRWNRSPHHSLVLAHRVQRPGNPEPRQAQALAGGAAGAGRPPPKQGLAHKDPLLQTGNTSDPAVAGEAPARTDAPREPAVKRPRLLSRDPANSRQPSVSPSPSRDPPLPHHTSSRMQLEKAVYPKHSKTSKSLEARQKTKTSASGEADSYLDRSGRPTGVGTRVKEPTHIHLELKAFTRKLSNSKKELHTQFLMKIDHKVKIVRKKADQDNTLALPHSFLRQQRSKGQSANSSKVELEVCEASQVDPSKRDCTIPASNSPPKIVKMKTSLKEQIDLLSFSGKLAAPDHCRDSSAIIKLKNETLREGWQQNTNNLKQFTNKHLNHHLQQPIHDKLISFERARMTPKRKPLKLNELIFSSKQAGFEIAEELRVRKRPIASNSPNSTQILQSPAL